jgi:signal transduction histidine kinase/CheY-like chemotaxis protein
VSLRHLLEALDHVVFVLDAEGRVSQVFGRSLAREGIDPTSLLGRRVSEILGAEAGALHVVAHARAIAGERSTFEWWVPGPTGARHFETSLSPIVEPGGHVRSVAGVALETTSERLRHAERLIAERAAPVGIFASGMAHQINNPLATVMANLEYTLRELGEFGRGPLDAEQVMRLAELTEPLRDARDAAERIRGVVRDLQRFASFGPERSSPVDVNRALDSLLSLMWKEIQPRARLVKDYSSTAVVRANEGRLREVFLNLIRNAVQALPEGDAEHQRLSVATAMEGQTHVVVTITDTGEGISSADLPRIFDPFFTTRLVGSGTGLGLAVCRRVVSELGGHIQVESEVGRGSTFRVTLPIMEAEGSTEAAGPTSNEAVRGGRVLVIDDEPALGRAVRRCLMADHQVVVVTSAREAHTRLTAGERFDVIICDLIMPGMSGMELHAELERTDPVMAARMLFITGGAALPEAQEFLARVPNPRVDKPFESKNLAAIVARLLR